MAKKTRVRYSKEEAFKIAARVNAAKKANKTWPEIHVIAKEAGYKGGVDSLKQRYGSKSHRVGNAKKPKVMDTVSKTFSSKQYPTELVKQLKTLCFLHGFEQVKETLEFTRELIGIECP